MRKRYVIVGILTILQASLFCPFLCAGEEATAATSTTPVETQNPDTQSASSSTSKNATAPTAVSKLKSKTMSAASVASAGGVGGGEDLDAGSVGKGGSLSPLLSESFQTDLATGSATANIPIVVPPGRKNMQPSIALSYSNNNPNGVCGVGWVLTSSSIQRSTKKGMPKYDNTDTFVFASSGSSGDLVCIDAANGEYRQKIETGFMKYVFDSANKRWTIWDKNGSKYIFGTSPDSRIINSDGTKIFAWFVDRVVDVYGNAVVFTYEKDGGQIYLSKANYASNDSTTPQLSADKEVDFIYESGRTDISYNNRSGWSIQTDRRLKEVQVKVDGSVVWRYAFDYIMSGDTKRSLLSQIILFDASGKSLPPKKFTYQTIE